uniref:Uncharacterized protein n=1 Tax=Aquila chrysaetos chrysaetos TaxID=223781 RepID=A0A663EJS4_AQUCH
MGLEAGTNPPPSQRTSLPVSLLPRASPALLHSCGCPTQQPSCLVLSGRCVYLLLCSWCIRELLD